MKRFILLNVFITLFLLEASAQLFRAGILAGAAITDIAGADLVDRDNDFNKWGFSLGGLVNTNISPKSLIQMEIVYIQKGTSQLANLDSSYIIALNYIDVSFVLKHTIRFKIKGIPRDRFGIEEGITTGTIVGSHFTYQSNDLPITNLNKIDLSLLLGINYKINSHLFLSLRYSNSIIHAIKHTSNYLNIYPYTTFNNGNNLVYQITLGYVFNKTKKNL